MGASGAQLSPSRRAAAQQAAACLPPPQLPGTAPPWRAFPPLLLLLQGQSTLWNSTILSLCPSLTAPYKQPSLLNNGHVETIFAAWFRWVGSAGAGLQAALAFSPLPPCSCCSGCCSCWRLLCHRKKPHVMYDREVVHMPDGGCVALDTEVLPASQVGLLALVMKAVGGRQ